MPERPASALGAALTEQSNPASENIDQLPVEQILRIIHAEDCRVAGSVAPEIPNIARTVDSVVAAIHRGGRLFYLGAGTSGRLGVLDACECPPTFGVEPELVTAVIAGGDVALRNAAEGYEDDAQAGAADLRARGFKGADALIGIAASGRTPYVLGAMEEAKRVGALTGCIVCAPESPVAARVQYPIELLTGAEVIIGSTRLKAGTATKLALNMISSGVMVKLGHVYSNLMVNVQPTNAKLVDRAQRILMKLVRCERERAAELLEAAGRNVRTALVMGKLGLDRAGAEERLAAVQGRLREALKG